MTKIFEAAADQEGRRALRKLVRDRERKTKIQSPRDPDNPPSGVDGRCWVGGTHYGCSCTQAPGPRDPVRDAAPALLETLKEAVGIIHGEFDGSSVREPLEWLQRARAALALAEGK